MNNFYVLGTCVLKICTPEEDKCLKPPYQFGYFEASEFVTYVIEGECDGILYHKLFMMDYNNVAKQAIK